MENKKSNITNKIPFKFDSRYVFSDTSTRILRLLGDERVIENLVMSTRLPYVFTNDPRPLIFNFSLSEAMLKEPISQISWLLIHKNVYSPILISFNLTENTLEKTVLVIFEIEIEKRELIPEIYYDKIKKEFPQICIEMIKNLEKVLEEDSNDIYHYESKIFLYSREQIWEIITNFHSLMTQQGLIKNCSMQTPITKEGCELHFIICSKNRLCRLKINKYKKDEKNDKWTFGIIPLCGPFAHLENDWTLIKIDDNETLVTNTSKYSEHIDSDNNKKLTDEKIEIFKTIEALLKYKYEDNINNDKNNFININNIKKNNK